uniref:Phosphoglycerate mutase n=2 Tax=Rhodosorus marinus TaxID=101924 RepID=A0A6T6LAC5_9RHOD|mmetsp:Transcript_16394/g.23707  ORF Transcript_16394/g.23707 Transcript_16394/m.23707 type:complete len:234 (+) Transcript_16394:61-762(+)|eukprot:CAMPEP_0184752020 /NCGR_PEP_ID=MMETSP0315-20130426/43362_1 /TAXON_ID=101924 /ORGANISM="Rhodosorus marinus, Strain UTEX LB 2760" /LENGTH=233 /DNA_ID=CAMNT_0027231333 /DNA_START=157 /DNA_END=858 /DNA_ORIENTATION=+
MGSLADKRLCERLGEGIGAGDLRSGEKILHLIRHGQGSHNLDAIMQNSPCVCATSGRAYCCYNKHEHVDARLTDLGREQASSLSERGLVPELILVSPLTRTLQTATLAFPENKIPMVVKEDIREVLGLHECDRRGKISEVRKNFHYPTFGEELDEEDLRFKSYYPELEPHEHVWKRGTSILDWIAERPEKELALVTHSGFLRRFIVGSVACYDDDLKRPWKTGEARSVVVTFD